MNISRDYKPKLPVQQLAILAVVRFAEPVALTSVFPYLPEMIESFGIEKNNVARWAGLVGATFSVCQSITAVPWGWASDHFGRKPAMLTSLTLVMCCFIAWGMSTSLPMAIVIRGIQGAASGNVGIIRTVVAEMVTERVLQPKAFSIMPLVWSIGSIFGPAFGGFFARPADHFPGLFGNKTFFKKFPFLLPNLIASVLFLVSCATAALFLKETLESKKHHRDWGLVLGDKLKACFSRKKRNHRRQYSADVESSEPFLFGDEQDANQEIPDKDTTPKMRDIITYQTSMVLLTYASLALHSIAYDQVLPVFLNYPRVVHTPDNTKLPFWFSGGFGLSSDSIGTIFTIYGVGSGLIQFLVFPPLCTRFGPSRCFKGAALLFPAVYVATPFLALVEGEQLQYFALVAIMLVKGFAGIVGFPCITILLTNAAPSLKVLGTLNGLATMTSGLGRAAGPALIGFVFSWGLRHGYMIAPWWLLAILALFGAIPAWFIVEGDGPTASAGQCAIALPGDGDLDSEAETLLEGEEEEESEVQNRQLQVGRTIVGGPSTDLLGVTEELLLEADTDSDCPTPPLQPTKVRSEVGKPVVKLHRMSSAGHEIERERPASRHEPQPPSSPSSSRKTKPADDDIAEESI